MQLLKSIVSSFFIFSCISFPQLIESPKNDFKNFFKVGADIAAAPTHFESDDWLRTFLSAAAIASSFLIDGNIKEFALDNRGTIGDALFNIDDIYHIEFIAASIAAIYIYGTSSKNTDARNLGLRLAEATVYSGSITLFGKFVLGRKRPTYNNEPLEFEPFNTSWEKTSLPSGHTTISFAYSTVMASASNNFLWKFSWYSLAVLVGAARVYNNEHWFSDVLLGGVIGYFIGDYVNSHYTNQKVKNASAQSNVMPNFSISFGFSF